MSYNTLFDLLSQAKEHAASRGIISYSTRDLSNYQHISYATLAEGCWKRALVLQKDHRYKRGKVVMIHFDDHLDNITWFWSVLLSGCVPALSSPLPNDPTQRGRHLEHLVQLFENPICLTRQSILKDFAICPSMVMLAIEDLSDQVPQVSSHVLPPAEATDLAILMLTSGSTGSAKAVCLTHRQILASLIGKDSVTNLTPEVSLLNWVGMDHVAALVETHLLAMYRGLDQVQIQATDVVADPLVLLELITKHQVARTVAPNFLLAALQRAIVSAETVRLDWLNLSSLTQLVSGGEANPVELCLQLDQSLRKLGAKRGVLQPAFGMTETCAGCTYNTKCPGPYVDCGRVFESLGTPVDGFEFRIMTDRETTDSGNDDGYLGRKGALQIHGPQVFSGYYRNQTATAEAFTPDGWFTTGDEASIDAAGNLHLVGRVKDQIRINGISIVAADVETHLNGLRVEGATNDYYACFGYRPTATESERLAALYLPTYSHDDERQRKITNASIADGVINCCGVSPFVLPLDLGVMQKSTLGKLSRSKLRRQLEQGDFKEYIERNEIKLVSDTSKELDRPMTDNESRLLDIVRGTLSSMLDLSEEAIQSNTPWYSFGITSLHLIRLKRDIELAMGISNVPLLWLLSCSDIRELAAHFEPQHNSRRDSAIEIQNDIDSQYDPVIQLRSQGSQAPIWFFHPGVGEILIFINLAKLITDRPVYAIRARGFNPGETFFKDINDAVETYYSAIKAVQPNGPYALAGYSYGAILAFETAKRLNDEGSGEEVQFLASLNLPPHIKFRMQQLDWSACALHLASFLGLLPVPYLENQQDFADHDHLLDVLFKVASPERLVELSLTPEAFAHWADLAHAMQSMAREYEPSGAVRVMDVFYCDPLAIVATSKSEWMDNHIGHWKDFSDDVKFHEVGGEHYTMIGPEHVDRFCKDFLEALDARGL